VLEKIAKATRSPQSLAVQQKQTNNADESNTASPSSLELRMLTMIENQSLQIQKMQAQLDTLSNMMAQMGGDVRYLCDSQQRHHQSDGIVGRRNFLVDVRSEIPSGPLGVAAGRVPPPPPPLPPLLSNNQTVTPIAANQTAPNQGQPPAAVADPPFQRGIFFPMFNYIFQGIVSFITNFRSMLLSTAPGRLYNHLRNEAIQRRAFANVDLRALVKFIVMVAVLSGRLDRSGGGGRRVHNRRAQENNDGGENGIAALFESFVQNAVVFLRIHRVPILTFVTFIAFLIQSGLMSFFYEVLWVEREVLVNVLLGRRDEAEGEGAGENNDEAERDVQADGQQQNADVRQPAQGGANQPAGIQARAGPNPRNIRPFNVHRRGGMIRRGPNGGFLHDIQCLVFSFILSLIPAWKPEEAAPPPGAQLEQQEGQEEQGQDPQQRNDDAAGGDVGNQNE
jgi:hypothetical protein